MRGLIVLSFLQKCTVEHFRLRHEHKESQWDCPSFFSVSVKCYFFIFLVKIRSQSVVANQLVNSHICTSVSQSVNSQQSVSQSVVIQSSQSILLSKPKILCHVWEIGDNSPEFCYPPALVVELLPVESLHEVILGKVPEVLVSFHTVLVLKKLFCKVTRSYF